MLPSKNLWKALGRPLCPLHYSPLANSEHGLDGIAAYGIGDRLVDPVPKMATVAPSDTCSEFITVPAPVCNPHPNGAKSPRGKSLRTLTRDWARFEHGKGRTMRHGIDDFRPSVHEGLRALFLGRRWIHITHPPFPITHSLSC